MTPVTAAEPGSSRWASPVSAAATVLLFALFFLHVLFGIDPRLLYHHQCPVFLTGVEFLQRFLDRPGGPGEYVSLFLSQFCYYRWAGAAVITGVTFLICMATRRLLTSVGEGRPAPWVYCLPGVLLLTLYGRYNTHLATSVALLGVLVFTGVFVRMNVPRARVRFAVFVVSAGVLYYLVGAMVVLFGVLCGVHELWKRRAIVPGAACLVIATVLPLGFATYSYELSPAAAYGGLLASGGGLVHSVSTRVLLPMVVHVVLLVFFAVAMVLRAKPGMVQAVGKALRRGLLALRRRTEVQPPQASAPSGRWTLLSLCLFLLAANALVGWSFDTGAKRRLQLGLYAREEHWEQVLAAAHRVPSALYDALVGHDVNRALYHTGRMPYQMFAYPQRRDSDSLFLSGIRAQYLVPTLLKSSVIYFELGMVNRSQKIAHMAYETFGEHPDILKLLIRINVLKGRLPVARGFLGTLSRNRLYRHWTEDFTRRLEADPDTASDEDIRRLRSSVPTGDLGWPGTRATPDYEALLEQLLQTNPHNRMAFEYLMAHYLITKQPDKVVGNVGRLDDFDYDGLPGHYAEAILLYTGAHPGQHFDLHGRTLGDETRQRLRDFGKYFAPYRNARGPAKQQAFEAMLRNQGGSYFFYYTADFSVRETELGYLDVTTGATK